MPEDTNTEAATVEAPDANTTETTPTLSPEDMSRELEKVRKEAAKYRTKLREREEAEKATAEQKRQADMTLEERVKAAEKKAAEAESAAEARIQAAERRAALDKLVTNPDRVLRLMDDPDEYFDGTEPNADAITKAFPEYGKKASSVDIPGSKSVNQPGNLRPDDFRGKSDTWIAANLHRLKPPSKD